MEMDYTSMDEKFRRLHGVVAMYGNIPVMTYCNGHYISICSDPLHTVQVTALLNEDKVAMGNNPDVVKHSGTCYINYKDPRFDVHNIKLGYFNYGSGCHYVVRDPSRTYYQGINVYNTSFFGVRPNNSSWYADAGFAKALKNLYPSLSEARNNIENPVCTGSAFHKDFSISKLGESRAVLNRKGDSIGIAPIKSGDFVLFETLSKRVLEYELEQLNIPHKWES